MTLGADRVHIWREPLVGGKVTSIDKDFTMSLTTRKRGGMNGSQILKGTGIEIEVRIKTETEKAGRKGIGTKRGHDFHTVIRTLKANPREKVETLKRKMLLKVMSELTRRRERKVEKDIENEIAKRIEIGITKTGTTVTEVKAKGKSHNGYRLSFKVLNKNNLC